MSEERIPQKKVTPSVEEISRQARRMLEAQNAEITDTWSKIADFKERIEAGRKKDADLLAELEAQKDTIPGIAELIARHTASMKLFNEAMEAELTALEAITTKLEEGRAALQAGLDELHTTQLETLDINTPGSKTTMQ